MISSLTIDNFKCFSSSTKFDLSALNLFTGYNGRGKSSVFQVLLLLAQSLHRNGNVEKLEVNGDFVGLLFRKGPNDGHYGSASGQVGLYENTCLLVY